MPTSLAGNLSQYSKNVLTRLLPNLEAGWMLRPLLQHALEQHSDAVIILDRDTALCRQFNHQALVLTGYSRPDLGQRRLDDLLTPEDTRTIREAQRSLPHGLSRTFQDVPLITQSGVRRHVDITLTNISPEQVRAFMITGRPAEKRQEQEATAAEWSERIEAMLQLTRLLDLMPDEVWGEVAVATARLVGAWMIALYVEDEAEGEMLLEAAYKAPTSFPLKLPLDYHPTAPTWDAGLAATDPLAEAAQVAGLGSLVQRPLGTEEGARVLLAAGFRARAAYRDKERLLTLVGPLLASLAERRLRSEAVVDLAGAHHSQSVLLDTLLANVTCGLVIIDVEGRIALMNKVGGRLLGYPTEEVLGRPFEEVLISRERLDDLVRDAMSKGVDSKGQEFTLLSREGLEVPVWLQVASIRPGANLGQSTLVVFEDRSQHKAMENQSRHLEQLSFAGEMSAIFAHEIRNPLAGISAGVQYLASKIAPDDPLQESLAMIQGESKRLSQLLEDILVVARPSQVEVAPTDLAALVQRSLDRWKSRLERKHIDVQFSTEQNLPSALVDAGKFEQVLANLFTNAIHAMSNLPQRGTLSVNLRLMPAEPNDLGYRGPRVQIDVGDTGPGMPLEVKSRVFDPFFTTKTDGTGLGLTIARRIIAQHDGTFAVESWEGVGTVFTITLPVAPATASDEGAQNDGNHSAGR
jgi:PAS domain S-box-containing protein